MKLPTGTQTRIPEIPLLRGLSKARDEHIAILQQCAEFMELGQLVIEVGEVFSLVNGADAHVIIEEGHPQGKVVLTM